MKDGDSAGKEIHKNNVADHGFYRFRVGNFTIKIPWGIGRTLRVAISVVSVGVVVVTLYNSRQRDRWMEDIGGERRKQAGDFDQRV